MLTDSKWTWDLTYTTALFDQCEEELIVAGGGVMRTLNFH